MKHYKAVEKLIQLIEKANIPIEEVEVSNEELSVRIVCQRQVAPALPHVGMSPLLPATPTVEVVEPTPVSEPIDEPEAGAVGEAICSPIVGTFYRSHSPGAKPFVELGQRVAVGDVLCIIEAMKMFNKIEADKAGVIVKCCVADGDPVEFDQPLFLVDKK